MADTTVLEAVAVRCAGSSPVPGTNKDLRCCNLSGLDGSYTALLSCLHKSGCDERYQFGPSGGQPDLLRASGRSSENLYGGHWTPPRFPWRSIGLFRSPEQSLLPDGADEGPFPFRSPDIRRGQTRTIVLGWHPSMHRDIRRSQVLFLSVAQRLPIKPAQCLVCFRDHPA